MSAMHWLWLGAIVLMMLSLAVLLPPLLAEVPLPAGDPDEALRRLYQTQLAELKLERSGGRLSETDHAQAVEELQRRLLSELDRPRTSVAWRQSPWLRRGSALLLAVLLPVAAFALYLQVGDPKAAAQLAQEQPGVHGDGAGDTQVQAMVDGLARRLEEQPQNLPGWVMLARSYETLELFDAAAQAYRRALQEARRSAMDEEVQARLWADLADALASAQGGDLDGEAGKAIKQALMLQPDQPKALALAGSAAARHGKLDEAQKNWQALLRQLEPGSDMALRVQDDLLKLEALVSEDSSTSTARTAAVSKSRLSGELRWTASKANPSEPARLAKAQVFVVARADGHPRPVAVLRLPATSLPAHFTLGPENLLDPAVSMSSFPELRLQARLSLDGQAMPRAGDIYSQSFSVTPGSSNLLLELNPAF
ncbi:c-type cytochrome biogenesis protein CcmI [Comamonas testosteroni]|uniref:Cytochrome c biogenesis factor n=1 Tax=Comamonas testosteroni TaxID=285 RepID=A0A8B4S114_COMTE|nr:c-type cytochrome biogenesis protein CcmI [Comamonas testosteroni]EHN64026.1 cytochrome C biogenesis protein [Comamonas testosteroni ATCC 11996]QQN69173.1 c-type cytochrome biogenesis protein CcmI [Comamonas testosteroni]SUY77457.1 Cytochrome c biogenesis factor [Comamonas testosteroni]